MATHSNPLLTPEEYLEREYLSEFRNEYVDGEIFAMAGTSVDHSRIVVNISRELSTQFRRGPCEVFVNDLRVKRADNRMYTYPDVGVVCGSISVDKYKGTETLSNPLIIFEVLSPSTEAYDRGLKFQRYQGIETLREYVLVSQETVLVERYLRQTNGEWLYSSLNTLEDSLHLVSAAATLKLSDIYERVFPTVEDSK
jgi:Uma2 family endonuclease